MTRSQGNGLTLNVVKFSELEPRPVNWLLHGWIPRGELSLLMGDPGLGKSVLATSIAAAASAGRPIEALSPKAVAQGRVLMLSAEDSPEHVTYPRLIAAEAKMDNLDCLTGMAKEGERHARPFSLGEGAVGLREYLNEHSDIVLMVVDPISAFFGQSVDTHRDSSVRDALHDFISVVRERRVAVLGIIHPNKNSDLQAIYRCSGSLATPALARSVFALVRHPGDPDLRVVAPIKSNMGQLGDCAEFRVTGSEIKVAPDETLETAVIEWSSEPCRLDRDEVLGAGRERGQRGPKPTARREAAGFLRVLLAGGPRPRAEIVELAEAAGISAATLERARKALGVLSQKARGERHGGFLWHLAAEGQSQETGDET